MKTKHESMRSYTIGFIVSLILTFTAYIPVVLFMDAPQEVFFTSNVLIGFVLFLAIIQMFVQLIFFLHLMSEKGSRWNLVFLISTGSIILLVVVGSLWIMSHLNYNHMTPEQTEHHLIEKEGIHK